MLFGMDAVPFPAIHLLFAHVGIMSTRRMMFAHGHSIAHDGGSSGVDLGRTGASRNGFRDERECKSCLLASSTPLAGLLKSERVRSM